MNQKCKRKQWSLSVCGPLWGHLALENLVNTGSVDVMLPDGTKPLPETVLTYHHWSFVVDTERAQDSSLKIILRSYSDIPQWKMS